MSHTTVLKSFRDDAVMHVSCAESLRDRLNRGVLNFRHFGDGGRPWKIWHLQTET